MYQLEYVAAERRKDFLRQAERHRLAQQALAPRQLFKLNIAFPFRLPLTQFRFALAQRREPVSPYPLPECCAA